MINPFHKLGKKINKALGGGGRRSSVASNGLQQDEDSKHETLTGDDSKPIQAQAPSDDNKGLIQNFSSGMENFIKAITETPRTHAQPLRTTPPEDDENGYGNSPDGAVIERTPEPPQVQLDENTPVEVLLARIEYLETSLRNELNRAEILEEQVLQQEARLQELERLAHRSFLSIILRPFRICFGGGNTERTQIRQGSQISYGY
jgi:hypothetical protein